MSCRPVITYRLTKELENGLNSISHADFPRECHSIISKSHTMNYHELRLFWKQSKERRSSQVAPEVLAGSYGKEPRPRRPDVVFARRTEQSRLRCDVWSLGAVCFMLVAGIPPFVRSQRRKEFGRSEAPSPSRRVLFFRKEGASKCALFTGGCSGCSWAFRDGG